MKIYIDDFYNNKYNIKYKINLNYLKNIIFELYSKYKINYLPIKLLYSIIFLIKYDINFKIIDLIIYKKILKKKYLIISKLIPHIINYKWINIINIALYNNVEKELINYFFELYNLYLTKENSNSNNIIKLQSNSLIKIQINYYRQMQKIVYNDIYYTLFYISIIFSKISKKYININYIYII